MPRAVETQTSRPNTNPDGSPPITRRRLLQIPLLVGAATLPAGCDILPNRNQLPGEIIEGGTILGTKEELVSLLLKKQQSNQAIEVDPDTGRFDSEDSITIIKSSAYLTMRQRGLSADIARLRANTIRLAKRSDLKGVDGISAPSTGPESIGIVLAKEFFDPRFHNSLSSSVALVSHEASHTSPPQYTEVPAPHDFGILGTFEQTGRRRGFIGNEEYPNDILRKLIQLPESAGLVTRADEFAAETGKVDFMLSLNQLPDGTGLNLDPIDIYYKFGFGDIFGRASEELRSTNKLLRFNSNTLSPEQISKFYQDNDRAGFFLSLGKEIVGNNRQTPSDSLKDDGNIRAVGLVVFTGFVMRKNKDFDRTGRINDVLNFLTGQAITPESISQQAQILASI